MATPDIVLANSVLELNLICTVSHNVAAAALMFPIAIDAAKQTGADSKLMSYNLMLAASASFMSK